MKRSLLSCCLLALALLTAHPAPAADMANTLVYAGENEDTINPVLSPHQELPTIIFSGLMKFDAKGLPVPDLAKSVDYDPKTLTYPIPSTCATGSNGTTARPSAPGTWSTPTRP